MNGKTQSILLQVAFKEAAKRGGDGANTKLLTSQFYVMLQELHSEMNIDADDGAYAPRGGGGSPRKPSTSGGGGFTPPTSATPFTTSDGTKWLDYRQAKTNGDVKPKFPDFKTEDGKESAYIYDQQGTPVPATIEILAAADAMASLAAPM